jgi:hypothetical protein
MKEREMEETKNASDGGERNRKEFNGMEALQTGENDRLSP